MGCAGGEFGSRIENANNRGVVVVRGPAVKAVTAGPAIIHAFSADKGGGLYFVPATTGTDADCAADPGEAVVRSRAIIEADRRLVFNITEGDLACLTTEGRGRFELLWHAYPRRDARPAVFVQKAR